MSSRHYQQVGTALSSRRKLWSQKGRGAIVALLGPRTDLGASSR